MSIVLARRRYLTNFEFQRLPHHYTDVLILGAGIAGLQAALTAADDCDVLVLAKSTLSDSNTAWAQGGIAAAWDPDDSPAAHALDTLNVACELGDPAIARRVAEEAPHCIEELLRRGARFDQSDGKLEIGREGGHSAARILHAAGDATGREILRALLDSARRQPRIRLFEQCFSIDLLTHDERVVGAITYHPKYGHQMFWATTTILATGGCGRVYRETTNPPVATGDGLAMAFRAGATLRNMEMIQFHPTTLYVAGAARALISEAVRGEGAYLVNRAGERFMSAYDSRGELASRDVVSRAIQTEMRQSSQPCVFLDVRHFAPGRFAERFPNIAQLCAEFDIRPERDLIPVRPSAHYCVGGVAVDADTQTSVPGLLAAGEVAYTGLHGANRLASNSLLEGLVFGRQAGQVAMRRARSPERLAHSPVINHLLPPSPRTALDLVDVLNSLRSVMSRNVGIERSADRLRETLEIIEFWMRYVMDKVFDAPEAWETQNMLAAAQLIATGAAARCESRGVHYRADYPQPDPAWRKHIDLRRTSEGLETSTVAANE